MNGDIIENDEWTSYSEEPDLTGDKTIQVGATGTGFPSDVTVTLEFTKIINLILENIFQYLIYQ